MNDFGIIFLSILFEALPFVLIGTIASAMIELFVSEQWVQNHLPKKEWIAYFVAGGMGLFFPICECAIVPVVRRLVKKGIPLGVAITFMLSVPILNPIVLLSTRYAFMNQPEMMWYRGLFGYAGAVMIGILVSNFLTKEDLVQETRTHTCSCGCGHHHDGKQQDVCRHEHNHSHVGEYDAILQEVHGHHMFEEEHCCSHEHGHSEWIESGFSGSILLKSVLSHTVAEFYEVGKFLIIGAGLSALMQVALPKQYWMQLSGNPIVSILVLMGLAFLLSLCSEADAFIAASLRGQFGGSSLLAFLIFGPMIDIKNTLMLATVFRKKALFRLILMIFSVCFVLSALAEYVIF